MISEFVTLQLNVVVPPLSMAVGLAVKLLITGAPSAGGVMGSTGVTGGVTGVVGGVTGVVGGVGVVPVPPHAASNKVRVSAANRRCFMVPLLYAKRVLSYPNNSKTR